MVVELWSGLGLHERVVALIKERGWSELTPIQLKAIPHILAGKNVLIMAPTGMGKTEAALLPILSEMIKHGAEPVSLLYVTPMKALINDLYARIKWWADRLGLRVARKHGDITGEERAKRVKYRPHILITTPESLEIDLDWAPRFRRYYTNLKWIIVDELHEFIGSKRGAQFALQTERLARLAGRDIQRIGLSATIGDPDYAIRYLSGSSKRPRVVVRSEGRRKPIIRVRYVNDEGDFWSDLARTILEEIEKPSLVFVNSRYMAEKIKHTLEEIGVREVFVHHSSVSPEIRREAEERLRRGELSAIVCTKTLEVGIDIGEITKVIQVKSPGSVASFVQRVGRSGHRLGMPPKGSIIAIGELDLVESVALASLAYEGYTESFALRRIPLDVIARAVQGILLERKRASIKEIYDIISSHPLARISFEEFERLINYLVEQGLLRREGDTVRLGSLFYKIWKFRSSKGRAWWARDFAEFFSLISDRDVFTVKYGDKIVGTLDSSYVYRFLRQGDVIRLSGRSWVVRRIDASLGKVEVEPSSEPGEIPLWRGESVRRARRLAERVMEMLLGIAPPHPAIIIDSDEKRIVDEWIRMYREAGLHEAGKDVVLYYVHGDEHIIEAPLGSRVSETLALILMGMLIREQGMNTYYRSSFLGFSVYNKTGADVIGMLSHLTRDRLEREIGAVLEKSPIYHQVLREIKLSLGKPGSTRDLDEGDLLVEEAKRQAIENYLDLDGAYEFIEKLRQGRLRVIRLTSPLTPVAKYILSLPPVKPWIPDLVGRIARVLEGFAFTTIEIADILGLSDKTVETKLKDMRKPEYGDHRVTCFYDVNEEDCRWVLVRDLEDVANMEDFYDSFAPYRDDDPLRVLIKASPDGGSREIIVTPRVILTRWRSVEKEIPEEVYMMKIHPAYGHAIRELTVTYYNVPRQAVKYLILNAASLIQKKRKNMIY